LNRSQFKAKITVFSPLPAERGVLVDDEDYSGAGTDRYKNTIWSLMLSSA
jgi:pantothenate kinase type III